MIHPTCLRCEYRTNPIGVDDLQPRLSWIIESDLRNQKQTAYRILVASSAKALARNAGDLWDSGKIQSDNSTAVEYNGSTLQSHQYCFWKVRTWDQDDVASDWSGEAFWSIGLLAEKDWKGEWIGFDEARGEMQAAAKKNKGKLPEGNDAPLYLLAPPYLRKDFKAAKPIARATLYTTSLGIADLYLNGQLINTSRFNPGWTDYAKRVYYRAYDVTARIAKGSNAIGAVLADGWFSGYVGWQHMRNHYGKLPRIRLHLRLEFKDGTSEEIVTAPDWKASYGPVREADILHSETYDARLEMNGWSSPNFNDQNWKPVVTGSTEVKPAIQWHPGEPVEVYAEIKPIEITEPTPGRYVFNLGQNFAGVVRLKVSGKAGQSITLRYAERLSPDGNIYIDNLRGARIKDTYILKGKGIETWEPRFTFHGFQYVEVTGLTRKLSRQMITGLALSSNTPLAGEFKCSDPILNRLHSNILWTQRSNFIDVPTDCPQRDERLGWTGDAQVYVRAATLNTDVQAFFKKWLVDLEDSQTKTGEYPCVAPAKVAPMGGGPAWADAGIICPWNMYEVYGDRRALERHYASMKKFVTFTEKRCKPDLTPPDEYHCFGDWLNHDAEMPKDVIFMAYFAECARLMMKIAQVLSKKADAKKYADLLERVRASFQKNYVDADGRIKGSTQTCYILAIVYDLVTADQRSLAAKYLVEEIEKRGWHLSTGFVGTKDIMLALAKIGRNDVAYRLMHNTTFPSWGFSIKHGATSIWERWDGWTPEKGFQDPGMNSFAHYAYGAVYQWMVENIGGIQNDGVGYDRIRIAPEPGGKLKSARVAYQSIHGKIVSDWEMRAASEFILKTEIPANTCATIVLPTKSASAVTERGKSLDKTRIEIKGEENGRLALILGSGKYRFVVKGKVLYTKPAGK